MPEQIPGSTQTAEEWLAENYGAYAPVKPAAAPTTTQTTAGASSAKAPVIVGGYDITTYPQYPEYEKAYQEAIAHGKSGEEAAKLAQIAVVGGKPLAPTPAPASTPSPTPAPAPVSIKPISAPPSDSQKGAHGVQYFDANTRTWHPTDMRPDEIKKLAEMGGGTYAISGEIVKTVPHIIDTLANIQPTQAQKDARELITQNAKYWKIDIKDAGQLTRNEIEQLLKAGSHINTIVKAGTVFLSINDIEYLIEHNANPQDIVDAGASVESVEEAVSNLNYDYKVEQTKITDQAHKDFNEWQSDLKKDSPDLWKAFVEAGGGIKGIEAVEKAQSDKFVAYQANLQRNTPKMWQVFVNAGGGEQGVAAVSAAYQAQNKQLENLIVDGGLKRTLIPDFQTENEHWINGVLFTKNEDGSWIKSVGKEKIPNYGYSYDLLGYIKENPETGVKKLAEAGFNEDYLNKLQSDWNKVKDYQVTMHDPTLSIIRVDQPLPTITGINAVKYLLDNRNDTQTLLNIGVDPKAVDEANQKAEAIHEQIAQLDTLASPESIKLGQGLSSDHSLALERAIGKTGEIFVGGTAASTWQELSKDEKQEVAAIFLADTKKDDSFRNIMESFGYIGERFTTDTAEDVAHWYDNLKPETKEVVSRVLVGTQQSPVVVSPLDTKAKEWRDKISGIILQTQEDINNHVSSLPRGARELMSVNQAAFDLATSMAILMPIKIIDILQMKDAGQMMSETAALGMGILTMPLSLGYKISADPSSGIAYAAGTIATLFIHPASLVKKTFTKLSPYEISADTLAFQADVSRAEFWKGMTPLRGTALVEAIELVHIGKYDGMTVVDPITGKQFSEVARVGHDVVVKDISGNVIGHVSAMQRFVPDVLYSATDYPESLLAGVKEGEFVVGKTGIEQISVADKAAFEARGRILFASQQPAFTFGEKSIAAFRTSGDYVRKTPEFILDIKDIGKRKEAFYEWAKTESAEAGYYPLFKGYGEPFTVEYEWGIVKMSEIPIKPTWYSTGEIVFPNAVARRSDAGVEQLVKQGAKRTPIQEPNTGLDMSERVTVLPVNDNGGIVLVRSKASNLPDDIWESVGGGTKTGDSPEITAIREVAEEIGIAKSEADLNPLGYYEGKVNQFAMSGSRVYVLNISSEVPKLVDLKESSGLKVWDGKSLIKVTPPVYDILKGYDRLFPNKIDMSLVSVYETPEMMWAKVRDTKYSDRIITGDRYFANVESANRNEMDYLNSIKKQSEVQQAKLVELARDAQDKVAHVYLSHPISGQPVPMLMFGDVKAISEGKGVIPLGAKYGAEAFQTIVQPVRELVHARMRPIEFKVFGEGETVSPLTSKFSAIEVKIGDAKMKDFVKAEINVPPGAALTMIEFEKAGSKVILRLKDTEVLAVREYNLADAEYIPKDIASELLDWVKNTKDVIGYGSFVEWIFNEKAVKPHDADIAVKIPEAHRNTLQAILNKSKMETRIVGSGGHIVLEAKINGEWTSFMDLVSHDRHYKGLWKEQSYGLSPSKTIEVSGIKLETLGDQIVRRGSTILKKTGVIDRLPIEEILREKRAKDIPKFQSDAEYLIDKSNKTQAEKVALRDDLQKFLGDYATKYAKGLETKITEILSERPVVKDKVLPSKIQEIRQQAYERAKAREAKGEKFDEAYLDELVRLSEKPFVITIGRLLYPARYTAMDDAQVFDAMKNDKAIMETFKFADEGVPSLKVDLDKLADMARDTKLEGIYKVYPDKSVEEIKRAVAREEVMGIEEGKEEVSITELKPYESPPEERPLEEKPYEPPPYEKPYEGKPYEPPPPPPPPPPDRTIIRLPQEPFNKERIMTYYNGRVAWYQGRLRQGTQLREQWYLATPPYKAVSDIKRQFSRPRNAYVVYGLGAAYQTIQKLGFSADAFTAIDWGMFDVQLRTPKRRGEEGALKFEYDRGQKTRHPIRVQDIQTVSSVL